MVLIATKDLDLARRLAGLTVLPRSLILEAESATKFRHEVYRVQPRILLLDVHFGGSEYKVTECVPRIMAEARSRPAVIAFVQHSTPQAEEEAAKLGCFDVIDLSRRGAWKRAANALEVAFEAVRSRQWPPSGRESSVLH